MVNGAAQFGAINTGALDNACFLLFKAMSQEIFQALIPLLFSVRSVSGFEIPEKAFTKRRKNCTNPINPLNSVIDFRLGQ